MENKTAFVYKFFKIPHWYIMSIEKVDRFAEIIIEAGKDLHTAMWYVSLDCFAMCNGCIFCTPQDFKKIHT
jgi:hypothetical protein